MLPSAPRPEYPRPRLRRRDWINLNGAWRFAFDQPTFDRSIVVPFAYQSELSGIGRPDLHDTVWYMRRFPRPNAQRLMLHFGAVDYRATVWINDVEVATHDGGHTPFSVDITSVVEGGENELVVRADDPASDRTLPRGKQFWKEIPEGIFYTATTGIWQTVWLEPLPHSHVTSLHLWPSLDDGVLDFEVATAESGIRVQLEIMLDGRPVGSLNHQPGRGRVSLSEVVPWTPDSPVLYDVVLRLVDNAGRKLDRVDSYFGLRSVAARDGRFWLNGEPYIQRLVLDQGYFPGGWYTAASDEDLRRDIELAKAFGFNGARKHQKIEDPRWLYWADRLGFLVWAEMPNFQQHTEQAERRLFGELAAAIDRDHNHPCVVAWVPVNESFGLDSLSASDRGQFLLRLYRLVHRLDGSRPVSSNDGWEHALTDLCSLHDYGSASELSHRYRQLSAAFESAARPRPAYLPGFSHRDEPVLVSEFGGIALAGESGGYTQARTTAELLREFHAMVDALMREGPVEGFCYTQLTDIEQERNGLLTFDRRPKIDTGTLRPLTQTAKRR